MFFVQNLVWGGQVILLAGHLDQLRFDGRQISYVLATSSVAAAISPLIAGWLADRYFAGQRVAGVCYLASAPLLWLAWRQTEFTPLLGLMLLYSLLHAPAMSVLNAVALRHLPDRRHFGRVRVWGSIGWISISCALSLYLRLWEGWDPDSSHLGDGLVIAAGLSVLMGVYCLTLPHTMPQQTSSRPLAFLAAFRFLRVRSFAVLLVTAFLASAMMPFSYNFSFIFFTDTAAGPGVSASTASLVLTLGQLAELPLMPLLSVLIVRLGLRRTIFLGLLAQAVRSLVLALGGPLWTLIAAQALGGVVIVCFIVAATIAMDHLCPKDERASAQGLLVFALRGVGPLLGHMLAGQAFDLFTFADGTHQWGWIFFFPGAISLATAVGFLLLFRNPDTRQEAD
jgi:nucleoside transporter